MGLPSPSLFPPKEPKIAPLPPVRGFFIFGAGRARGAAIQDRGSCQAAPPFWRRGKKLGHLAWARPAWAIECLMRRKHALVCQLASDSCTAFHVGVADTVPRF